MYFCGLMSSRFYKETAHGLFLRYAYIFSMLRNLSNFLKLLSAWIGYHYSNLKVCDQRLSLIKLIPNELMGILTCPVLAFRHFTIHSLIHSSRHYYIIPLF